MKMTTQMIARLGVGAAFCAALVLASTSASGQTLVLSGTSYSQDFNAIESGLPDGWTVRTSASASTLGTISSWQLANSSPYSNSWAATSGRFANHASIVSNFATNFNGSEIAAVQFTNTDRALGVRQTGSLGDPGGAFVLRIDNTIGLGNFNLALDFLNLNPQTRQTIYTVDYAVGATPTSFIPVGTYTNLSTGNGGVFGVLNKVLSFGTALNDQSENVWIRIAALSASTGSGNRSTFGIDNFNLTWEPVVSTPQPPQVINQPQSRTNLQYSTATFSVAVSGTAPFTYQWKKDGQDVFNGATGNGSTILGADTATLTIISVATSDAGSYTVGITNAVAPGTLGGPAVLTVTPVVPIATNIAYLRTLVDPVTFVATNSTPVYTVTGTVTTFTNLTTGNTSSYYLQDSTAGINIFVTLGSTFRPAQGDVLAFTGFLSSFNSTLELLIDQTISPATGVTVLSNNIAGLPKPVIIPFSITNNLSLVETNLEGALVMLTNVYFGTNAGVALSLTNNNTIVVTNEAGETFNLFFSFQNADTAGQVLPAFASTVIGPLTQNLNNTATPRNAGYSVTVTRFSDIVTNLPVSVVYSGSTATLGWPAAPVTYTYGISAATDVAGPYTPLTNSLRFLDAAGSFIDSSAGGGQKFYKITTP